MTEFIKFLEEIMELTGYGDSENRISRPSKIYVKCEAKIKELKKQEKEK